MTNKEGKHIQSVLYYKNCGWTKNMVVDLAKCDGFLTENIEETDKMFILRQQEPDASRFQYRNVVMRKHEGKDSVVLVYGYPNKGKKFSSLARIAALVHCQPWLILPSVHEIISGILQSHIDGKAHEKGSAVELFAEKAPENDIVSLVNDFAVVRVNGVISKHVSGLEKMSGVVDVDEIAGEFDEMVEDQNIKGIILDINSPGGNAAGVPEFAAKIAEARGKKPVVAYVDYMAASGAYWLAAQAHAIVSQPSAMLGSIGVYMSVLDQSKRYEMAGVKNELVKSGKYKAMGLPGTSLTTEQRDLLQTQVNDLHAEFISAVKTGRGVSLPDEMMQGQTFSGREAVKHGFADELGDHNSAMELVKTMNKNK